MAAKIKLGATPKNFKPFPVSFDMPDGDVGVITPTYKYRTRAQFGEMMNQMFKDAGEEKTEGMPDFQKLFEKMGDKNADHLLACIDSWDQDFDLTRENLLQMTNEVPASSAALMAKYRDACIDGRLGN